MTYHISLLRSVLSIQTIMDFIVQFSILIYKCQGRLNFSSCPGIELSQEIQPVDIIFSAQWGAKSQNPE